MDASALELMRSHATPVPAGLAFVEGGGPALQLSRRQLDRAVAFSTMYEFEDVIADVTRADRLEPLTNRPLEISRRAYKALRVLTHSRRLARWLAPAPPQLQLNRDYELFLPVFNNPYEVFALAAVPNWRARARKAACFVMEYWPHQYSPRYLLEMFGEFDHIFVGLQSSVEAMRRHTGRPCSYLPPAVDLLRFSPLPRPPPRSIDVCNLGRRSEITHQALLRLARDRRIHYYYDTIAASGANLKQRTFNVDNAAGHRQLLGSVLQRSRYFIANRARVNEEEYSQHLDEISYRFYEGAGAGAVMLGEAPRTENFRQQFDWPDAVIHLPFNSPDIGEIIAALDTDPERLSRARRNNLHFAALRHDWVYRIRTIFQVLELPPPPAMLEREARLQAMAQQVLDAPAGTF